jgi:hypothetical protein
LVNPTTINEDASDKTVQFEVRKNGSLFDSKSYAIDASIDSGST